MAVFTKDDESRLDWQLLYDGPITKFYSEKLVISTLRWLREHEYRVIDIDCTETSTTNDVLRKIGESLQFPDYFTGESLDAFDDLLYDIPIPFNGGLVVVLRHFDRIANSESRRSWQILNIFANHSRRNSLWGLCLITLLQSANPKLEIEPIGAHSVRWNKDEWMDFQRGLCEAPDWWSNNKWSLNSLSGLENLTG